MARHVILALFMGSRATGECLLEGLLAVIEFVLKIVPVLLKINALIYIFSTLFISLPSVIVV